MTRSQRPPPPRPGKGRVPGRADASSAGAPRPGVPAADPGCMRQDGLLPAQPWKRPVSYRGGRRGHLRARPPRPSFPLGPARSLLSRSLQQAQELRERGREGGRRRGSLAFIPSQPSKGCWLEAVEMRRWREVSGRGASPAARPARCHLRPGLRPQPRWGSREHLPGPTTGCCSIPGRGPLSVGASADSVIWAPANARRRRWPARSDGRGRDPSQTKGQRPFHLGRRFPCLVREGTSFTLRGGGSAGISTLTPDPHLESSRSPQSPQAQPPPRCRRVGGEPLLVPWEGVTLLRQRPEKGQAKRKGGGRLQF